MPSDQGCRERIGHVLVQKAMATEQPLHRRHQGRQDVGHVHRRRGWSRMEPHMPTGRAREHPVEHEGMDVHVEIQGPTESLECGDAFAPPVAHAVLPRPSAQVSLDGAV